EEHKVRHKNKLLEFRADSLDRRCTSLPWVEGSEGSRGARGSRLLLRSGWPSPLPALHAGRRRRGRGGAPQGSARARKGPAPGARGGPPGAPAGGPTRSRGGAPGERFCCFSLHDHGYLFPPLRERPLSPRKKIKTLSSGRGGRPEGGGRVLVSGGRGETKGGKNMEGCEDWKTRTA
ncbi:unnamed protein product, partial [Prorocentrum cordatum]